MSEIQELRRGRMPLLTNLKLRYWSLWSSQYSMAVDYMWREVYGAYDRHFSDPLTAGWELRTADRRLATCLRASVAHNTVTVHPLQSNDRSGLESFSLRFVFSCFHFSPFCIFPCPFRFRLRDFYVSVSVKENHTACSIYLLFSPQFIIIIIK